MPRRSRAIQMREPNINWLRKKALQFAASGLRGLTAKRMSDLTPIGGWEAIVGTIAYQDASEIWRSYTTAEKEKIMSKSSVVYACIRKITTSLAEPDLYLGHETPDGFEPKEDDDLLELVTKRPNKAMDYRTWIGLVGTNLLIGGESYIWEWRNNARFFEALWPVPSSWVKKETDASGNLTHYSVWQGSGKPRAPVDPQDMTYIYIPDPSNPTVGLGPMQAAIRDIQTDDERQNYMAEMLVNMKVPGLVLTQPEGWTPEQQTDAKAAVADIVGKGHRGNTLFIEGEGAKAEILAPLKDLDWPGLTNLTETRICAAFGVPPQTVNLRAGEGAKTFCLPADARIWTPEGSTRIADVEIGDEVWTVKAGEIVLGRVFRSGIVGRKVLYELRTKNRIIRATGNHPFLVRTPGNSLGSNDERHVSYEWRKLDEIVAGDRVVQPKALPDVGRDSMGDWKITQEFAQFAGAMIGDGTVSPSYHGVVMSMPPEMDRCAAHYEDLAIGLFKKKDGSPIHISKAKSGRDFRFYSADGRRKLLALGLGGTAHFKRVPDWVYGLTKKLRLSFLAGLVDTDGSIDKRGVLSFTFCNRNLTLDVRQLLISVGIQCSNVYSGTIKRENVEKYLDQTWAHAEYNYYNFVASSAKSVSEIPFCDPKYRERVETNLERQKKDGKDADKAGLSAELGFYKVCSVEPLWEEDVYDIEIAGTHSFIADGIVVHNSNYEQADRSFYRQTMVNFWLNLASAFTRGFIINEPGEEDDTLQFQYDLTEVRQLQEDEKEATERAVKVFHGSLGTRNEGRDIAGLDALDPEHGDVFVVPSNMIEVPATPGAEESIRRNLALQNDNDKPNHDQEWEDGEGVANDEGSTGGGGKTLTMPGRGIA